MFLTAQARLRLAAVVATAVAVSLGASLLADGAGAATFDRTSAKEAARVDRVKTPRLTWSDCPSPTDVPGAQCATAALPLDYDAPAGPKTEVALLRIKAAKPSKKVGTLFVNLGGPDESGVLMVADAPLHLSQGLLDRFDVVGFDPRGTNLSSNVRCWQDAAEQAEVLAPLSLGFPVGSRQVSAAVGAAAAFGTACSSTGNPLAASMSTAETARDLDVLRRAVGDKKLSYLGSRYGSYLGQVYANLFPDRVRAIAIDGVVDPTAWAGTAKTAATPQLVRTGTDLAAHRALLEILARCAKAGPKYCRLARLGDPAKVFAATMARAKKAPIVVTSPDEPDLAVEFTYADIYTALFQSLNVSSAASEVDVIVTVMATGRVPAAARAQRTAVYRSLEAAADPGRAALLGRTGAARTEAFTSEGAAEEEPYVNGPDAASSIACTDGLHGAQVASWPAAAAAAAKKYGGFGDLAVWATVQCASATWTARDEDAYRGPFTRRTSSPVLLVANTFDPSNRHEGAAAAAKLLPGSRLLSTDAFGTDAYGVSDCATAAIDGYLLRQTVPAKGKRCSGPKPFSRPLAGLRLGALTAVAVPSSHT